MKNYCNHPFYKHLTTLKGIDNPEDTLEEIIKEDSNEVILKCGNCYVTRDIILILSGFKTVIKPSQDLLWAYKKVIKTKIL